MLRVLYFLLFTHGAKIAFLFLERDHPVPLISNTVTLASLGPSLVSGALKCSFNFMTVLERSIVFYNRYRTVIKLKGRLKTLDTIEHLGTQGSRDSKGRGWDGHGPGTKTLSLL